MKSWFRIVGWLEALSFLALLGVAMPLKYVYGMTEATQIPGMLHGALFMAYVAMAFALSDQENWPRRKLLHAFVASVLPFGTIVFERKYLGAEAAPAR